MCLRQVVVLVVQPRDLKGHLTHAADGNTITSGGEEQKLFLKFVAVVVQNLAKDERKRVVGQLQTKHEHGAVLNVVISAPYFP